MMSKDKKFNFGLDEKLEQTYIESARKMDYVEDWFDQHPEPWNIDCHWFTVDEKGIKEIHVYFADMIYNCWMIKISCNNARKAVYLSKLLYKTTCQMGITQILINKKLFLFTDLRF